MILIFDFCWINWARQSSQLKKMKEEKSGSLAFRPQEGAWNATTVQLPYELLLLSVQHSRLAEAVTLRADLGWVGPSIWCNVRFNCFFRWRIVAIGVIERRGGAASRAGLFLLDRHGYSGVPKQMLQILQKNKFSLCQKKALLSKLRL